MVVVCGSSTGNGAGSSSGFAVALRSNSVPFSAHTSSQRSAAVAPWSASSGCRIAAPEEAAVVADLHFFLHEVEIVPEPAVEIDVQRLSQEEEHDGRVREQHSGQRHRVPEREAGSHAPRAESGHAGPSRTAKPTPRTVWISLSGYPWSTFFRRRAMLTSMTLSRGVARDGSFHTSRASISRDTTWPG